MSEIGVAPLLDEVKERLFVKGLELGEFHRRGE
jgi:hypothetical protein